MTHPPVRQPSTLLSHKHIYTGTNTLCIGRKACHAIVSAVSFCWRQMTFSACCSCASGKTAPFLYSCWLNIAAFALAESLGPTPLCLYFFFVSFFLFRQFLRSRETKQLSQLCLCAQSWHLKDILGVNLCYVLVLSYVLYMTISY